MDIKKYLNVLNQKEQSSILKLVDKKLTKIPTCPGLQTYPDLHCCEELKPLLESLKKYIPGNFSVDKCWANHTDGGYVFWHMHKADLTVVYYLKNKESLGTMFRVNNKIIRPKCPQNSLIIFKNEFHSAPPIKRGAPQIDRYAISFEISKKI
jgi:hypothetical protein